ncbi:hypothetical protein PV327_002500 [Microctonus hyperodae]|uniref:Uncharacterized protein n=1 Tax=Microctonus hyperodae TaxID=165561 RepID=A0AA39FFP3_MICHY|nr:hypothetical protein PV327_002500 [Microctonus hyperodae]
MFYTASTIILISLIGMPVFSGIEWGSQQLKSSCPPREKWEWNKMWNWIDKFEKKLDNSDKPEEKTETSEHLIESKEQKIDEKLTESNKSSLYESQNCEIKMQDPCAPCCCEIECIEPPPCTDTPPTERSPMCECAKRKQIKIGEKCCDACGAGLEVV